MNEERTIKLFDAITEVREAYVREAEKPLRSARSLGLGIAAACLCLLIPAWLLLQSLGVNIANPFPRVGRGDGTGGTGGQALAAYHSYAGPVLPLTAEVEGLQAERAVEFDFSLYDPGLKDDGGYAYARKQQACLVTDTYRVSPEEGAAGTRTLYYPFVSSLGEAAARLPKVTVNGSAAETELLVGPGSTSLLSWEDLEELMGEDCLDRALAPLPERSDPVIVYALSGLYGPAGENGINPTLSMEYSADMSRTAVLTWGFNGGTNDYEKGRGSRQVSVPRPGETGRRRTVYLIVLGEDIGDWTLQGYTDGGCRTPAEGIGATVTRYESTLGDMLNVFWAEYRGEGPAGFPDPEAMTGLTYAWWLERLPGPGGFLAAVRTGPLDLEDLCGLILNQSRVLYLRFRAELPAGEETVVEAKSIKYPSRDYGGPQKARLGFDLASKAGSRIRCTKLEASLTGVEFIRILRQDFGFDPNKGVLRAALDPEEEHWYMDVVSAAQGK